MSYQPTELMRAAGRLEARLSEVSFARDFNDVLPEAEIEDALRDFINAWNEVNPKRKFRLLAVLEN